MCPPRSHGELVLDRRGRLPVDVKIHDARLARFKKLDDPLRGPIWQLGRIVDGQWQAITADTVRYIPLDPAPDSPYGRPMVSPAMFTSLFLIGLLHDLRRVVAQQGYPRIDVEVKLDELAESLPEDVTADSNPLADTREG